LDTSSKTFSSSENASGGNFNNNVSISNKSDSTSCGDVSLCRGKIFANCCLTEIEFSTLGKTWLIDSNNSSKLEVLSANESTILRIFCEHAWISQSLFVSSSETVSPVSLKNLKNSLQKLSKSCPSKVGNGTGGNLLGLDGKVELPKVPALSSSNLFLTLGSVWNGECPDVDVPSMVLLEKIAISNNFNFSSISATVKSCPSEGNNLSDDDSGNVSPRGSIFVAGLYWLGLMS
jgi:hypothetical protein